MFRVFIFKAPYAFNYSIIIYVCATARAINIGVNIRFIVLIVLMYAMQNNMNTLLKQYKEVKPKKRRIDGLNILAAQQNL